MQINSNLSFESKVTICKSSLKKLGLPLDTFKKFVNELRENGKIDEVIISKGKSKRGLPLKPVKITVLGPSKNILSRHKASKVIDFKHTTTLEELHGHYNKLVEKIVDKIKTATFWN